jgi:hypothetical protein
MAPPEKEKIMANPAINRLLLPVIVPMVLLFSACTAMGPPTVARDRFDYVNAISDSWKRQMLLNLVKTRYMDAPVFLDVASIISQYSVEGTISLGADWTTGGDGNSATVGGTGRYADRPTITYAPLSGERFSRSLMVPIPVGAVLALLQSGYPADFVFRICVQTINGIDNQSGGQLLQQTADPRFYELLRLLIKIQQSRGIGMRVKPANEDDEDSSMVMFFRTAKNDTIGQDLIALRRILGVAAGSSELEVNFGSVASSDRELAIQTRSMLQIIIELASHIDVPQQDVAEGRVFAAPREAVPDFPELISIRSAPDQPEEAFVAVRYRDLWFWIDDRDLNSKRMFSFIMLMFSLTETGKGENAPVVTVPTN